MQPTSISWCDYTWNPLRGCSRISEGCRNCYAEKIAARFSRHVMDSDGVGTYTVEPFHGFAEYRTVGGKREAHWTGKVELIEDKLLEPLSWRRKAAKFRAKHGRKPRCFTNSMSDLFHERLLERSIARVFASMAFAPEIDFLCLTKRADRAESILGTGRFHDQIIDEMNASSVAINAAVEEQSAATREIARNTNEAASGAQDVSRNISGVLYGANQTGAASQQVVSASQELGQQAERLNQVVHEFLSSVRAA